MIVEPFSLMLDSTLKLTSANELPMGIEWSGAQTAIMLFSLTS